MKIFCVTNKALPHLDNTFLKFAGVGINDFPEKYLKSNTKINIFEKEKYYSELTFHYWYWKNLLPNENSDWVGFCQKRRFWIKSNSIIENINKKNLINHLLDKPEDDWHKYDSIICKPVDVSGTKKIKLIKRGWRNIINNPLVLLNKNTHTIKLHFDLHHGFGNLEKAIELLNKEDKEGFNIFVNQNTKFNPHIMFIARKEVLNKWFISLFNWLEKCEKTFGFDNLKGYETGRLYAYLAERYLSYWFKKNTRFKELPWVFINN